MSLHFSNDSHKSMKIAHQEVVKKVQKTRAPFRVYHKTHNSDNINKNTPRNDDNSEQLKFTKSLSQLIQGSELNLRTKNNNSRSNTFQPIFFLDDFDYLSF